MNSSEIISLFGNPSISRWRPSGLLISAVVHSAAMGMLTYGILYNPLIRDRIVTQRYTVRHLELHASELHNDNFGEDGITYPGPHLNASTKNSVQETHARPPAMRLLPAGAKGLQTLVQPEFHAHVALTVETPVPTIVIWTPELASSKEIVAPLPEKATAADVNPSLDTPNDELKLADLSVAATKIAPRTEAIAAGTTSPVTLRAPELLKLVPATISNSADQPTPTAVLSLSDIRMPEGSITLPPVNETKSSTSSATHAMGQAKETPESSAEYQPRSGAPGNERNAVNTGTKPEQAKVSPRQSSANPGVDRTVNADAGSEKQDGTYHITMPPDGHFGVVVVGTSLAEEYPETLEVWNDRVAYTVYLHVGLSKNWILQYSLVRSAETAAGGAVSRLEAPWPYDIWRPNLVSRDLNADALMIHGFLNQSGRLESLAIAFPAKYVRAAFVLHALRQWQFRPARQNGKATAVEVLLIIPDEFE